MTFSQTQMKYLTIGILMAFAVTSIIFLGYAMLITYTNVSERSLNTVVTITTVLSVMIAGFDAARGSTQRGWLWGMIAGLIYVLIMVAIMVILLPEFTANVRTVIICLLGIGGGGIGGVLGINIKK